MHRSTFLIKRIDLILLGFFIYCIGYAMLNNESSFVVLSRIVQIIGLCLLLSGYYVEFNKQICNTSFFRTTIIIFVLYGLILILRGQYETIRQVANKFYDRLGIFQYLCPLIVFLPVEKYFVKIIRMLVIMSAVYIPYMLISVNNMVGDMGFATISQLYVFLGESSVILLYFWKYLKRDWRVVCIISISITIIFAALLARRGLMLNIAIALVLNLAGYYFLHLHNFTKKIKIALSAILVAILLLLPGYFLSRTLFSNLIEKGTRDTRSHVELMLIDDLKKTPNDFIWGRGVDGSYYAPLVETNGDKYRNGIETGYLYVILKGGYVYLALFFLIMILALFKGLRSKEYISTQAALFTLQVILSHYHEAPMMFAPKYFMLWVCIALIYKSQQVETQRPILQNGKRV